jgi:hemerythrin-like domain-containing protein
MTDRNGRRAFLTIAGAGAVLAACRKDSTGAREPAASATASATDTPALQDDKGDDVSATEDLMREHGVIRRVLVVYREAAVRLRTKPASLVPQALQQAAKLMQTFAEDYHERQLEEAHIFPALMKPDSSLAGTVKTLIAQHQRGREITEYVLAAMQRTIGDRTAEPLARTLEAFALMYEEHAAVEDTIVFPAWKRVLSPKALDDMGDLFEDIEHQTFGKDGFADAVDRVGELEKMLGIDLASLTAPSPR